jgi:dTDP-4-amino-4,6-dideoxygalactose transaminase
VQALNLEPGSEVIVPAWTMSATVSSIIVNGLIPVLVDINLENYNVSTVEIEQSITNRTQAIMAVDIFGYPSDAIKIRELCDNKSLAMVIDSAQTPLAKINQQRTTEIADVGGYSFNRHKHIQVGEGGMAVTNDLQIASRLRAVRNHGEITGQSEIEFKGVGHNYRLGEIEAALANLQINDLEKHVIHRRRVGEFLIERLLTFPGISLPTIDTGFEHDFYILGIRLHSEILGVSKNIIYDALLAEGIPGLLKTYSELHKIPTFAKFANHPLNNIDTLNSKEFIGLYLCGFQYSKRNLLEIVNAFEKVWSNLNLLRL